MELNQETCIELLTLIEGNEMLRFFLHETMDPKENQLGGLSFKRALQLEAVTGVVVELNMMLDNIAFSKIKTLERFLQKHQWVHIDQLHTFQSCIIWLNAYKSIAGVSDGQRFVIHADGEAEVIDEEQYFKIEEEEDHNEEELEAEQHEME